MTSHLGPLVLVGFEYGNFHAWAGDVTLSINSALPCYLREWRRAL
uniref:Uncharacterized protein n=1 Tax=Anguilla anguilla TaxID=7936 RepID=A0A0E9QWI6_ANGAN